MATTTQLGRVRERSTGVYTAVLKDEAGVVIPAASLASLTLSLYDVASATILNERDDQDALNTNNVTVDGSGNLAWSVQPADHAVVSTRANAIERHRAVFRYSWSGGAKQDWHAVEFLVEAEREVT
jgi:hypothetical protein